MHSAMLRAARCMLIFIPASHGLSCLLKAPAHICVASAVAPWVGQPKSCDSNFQCHNVAWHVELVLIKASPKFCCFCSSS